MKKIKIAQIGTSTNSHGNDIWTTLLKQPDIFEVAGYAFLENEREKFPERMGAFEGYPEMSVEQILNDPEIEAVTVETEEIYLTKYALMVANAGKHMHMEKPGGRELADFERLIDILKSKKLVFSIGYMYRFNPKIQEALEKVKNGELGEIYSVEAHMNCKHNAIVRDWLEAFPGGMMFFLGCHLIDLIYRIQGEPLEILPLSCSTGFDELSAKDFGMAVFRYRNGVSFAKTCASECGGFLRRQLVICGEKGTIEIKPLEVGAAGGQYTVMKESYLADWHTPLIESQTDIYDRYNDMMKNFAYMVRGLRENPYSYDYELGLYKTILKACGVKI
ncbi:MAG: Gfo/Idh/MocA family oxidoreductase [Chloroflexi bacterium]|nr:Gfo/Idh/MocA family oxidoreductase [Chloroflexota bacterium]